MSQDTHHGRALIEEARLALDGAHRAALAADAGGLRRSLGLADVLLREAAAALPIEEAGGGMAAVRAEITHALADLDTGALMEMEALIETARTKLAQV